MQFTLATIIAALPFLAAASPVQQRPSGISIPISKRSTGGVSGVAKLRHELNNLQAKYDRTLKNFEINTGKAHPNAARRGTNVAKRSTGSDALTDSQEELWYGTISVGTPSVDFTIDFDTGSSDLFIPDSSCKSCGSHTTYDPSSSSTSKDVGKTFQLQYGDGSTTSGEQYTDTVTIAGLTVDSQTLGSATQYSSSFEQGPQDGLMGLAYPELSSYKATPFFNNLISAGSVDAGKFSFYLSKDGSSLDFGGADESHYSGNFNWNPVTAESYWQIAMDSVSVSQNSVLSELSVIVDSGTTLIVGDDANVKKFYDAIPGSAPSTEKGAEGMYTIPCDNVPDVSVTFNGVSYAISSDNIIFSGASSGSDCIGAVVSGNEGFWIMGDAFMKNVYTTFDFDNNQVGFASLA